MKPEVQALLMRAVALPELSVDKNGAALLVIPQCFGTSFIYSPPHTPKGLGRGYFSRRKERPNVC